MLNKNALAVLKKLLKKDKEHVKELKLLRKVNYHPNIERFLAFSIRGNLRNYFKRNYFKRNEIFFSLLTWSDEFKMATELREGAPIQLLKYADGRNGQFGKIVLNQDALDVLGQIREPWFPPFTKRVIVLVSEGIDDPLSMAALPVKSQPNNSIPFEENPNENSDPPKQDQNWAFIYNINGIVGRDDIGKLYLMTDLSKFIQEPEDGEVLPRLVILLRDFILENPDSFKDYFLEKLRHVNDEVAGGIFYDSDVYSLPHPGCNHIELVYTDGLDEKFVSIPSIIQTERMNAWYINSSKYKDIEDTSFIRRRYSFNLIFWKISPYAPKIIRELYQQYQQCCLNEQKNINEGYLKKLCGTGRFGITKDPSNYMLTMKHYDSGDYLHSYIDEAHEIDWKMNVEMLWTICAVTCDGPVYGNLHGGNLLVEDKQDYLDAHITDVGLHSPMDRNNSNEIYGVLPYVSPEVLKGNSPTKASDIYSFGIIMWMLSSDIRPWCNSFENNLRNHMITLKSVIKNLLQYPIFKVLGASCFLIQPSFAQEDNSFRVDDSVDVLITALLPILIYVNLANKQGQQKKSRIFLNILYFISSIVIYALGIWFIVSTYRKRNETFFIEYLITILTVMPISFIMLNLGSIHQFNPEMEYMLKNFAHLIRVIIHTVFFVIASRRNYVSNDVWFIICPYITLILYVIMKSSINYFEIRKNKSSEDFNDFRTRMVSFNEEYNLKHISLVYNTYGPLILAILCAPSNLWVKGFLDLVLFMQSVNNQRSDVVARHRRTTKESVNAREKSQKTDKFMNSTNDLMRI